MIIMSEGKTRMHIEDNKFTDCWDITGAYNVLSVCIGKASIPFNEWTLMYLIVSS